MTGKITSTGTTELQQTDTTLSSSTDSLARKTQVSALISTKESSIPQRTASTSRSTETIEKEFFDYLEKNYRFQFENFKSDKAEMISTILDKKITDTNRPKSIKMDFIEAYMPFLLLHFKEAIFEDHFLTCLSELKNLKAYPEFHPRITAIEDQIRSALEPGNNVTHAYLLKSLTDISTLPLYNNHDEVETAIGPDHMWRLVLDGAAQHDPEDPNGGIQGYEKREAGSVERLLHGYRFTLSQAIFSPITTNFIRDIHKNVASLAVAEHREAGEWGEKPASCTYSKIYTPADEDGLKYSQSGNFSHSGAFENMIDTAGLLMPTTSKITLSYGFKNKIQLSFIASHAISPEGDMQKLIDAYETKMAMMHQSDRYERLKTIVQFIHIAEINHPFQDGNCRTLCTCLLNRELIRHGFPPTLLWDPNYFDMLSTDEIMLEVLEGMKDFDTLTKTKTYARAMTLEMLTARRDHKMGHITEKLTNPMIPLKEQLATISQLSTLDKAYIKSLDLKVGSIDKTVETSLNLTINNLPNLTKLSISTFSVDLDTVFDANKSYPNITTFNFMNHYILPKDITTYFKKFPNLENLTLSNVELSPVDESDPDFHIPEIYGNLPNLKNINFTSRNSHMTNDENDFQIETNNIKFHLDALIKSAPNLERVTLPKDFLLTDLNDFQARYSNIKFSIEE